MAINFTNLIKNILQRNKEASVARVNSDVQQPNWVQNFITRTKNTIGIPSSWNAPIDPNSILGQFGTRLIQTNNAISKIPIIGAVGERIPREYGTQAGNLIGEGIKQMGSGQTSKVPFTNWEMPSYVAGPAKIGLGALNLTQAGVIGSYAYEAAKGAGEQKFGKDSLAAEGIGLVGAIVAPGDFKGDLAKGAKLASKVKSMEEAKNILQKVNKGGLLTETSAMSKFRRQAGLAVEDVYSKLPAKEQFDDFMRKSNTSVKDKVNIWDFFRTPDRVMKKIGLEKEATQIKTSWNNYLDELPKEVERITNWSKQVPKESNRLIFKYLDGQINSNALDQNELKVATEIKDYLKTFANKLGLPEDKRITNYITHIWEKDVKGVEFPEEIAALIRDDIPSSVYDPFVQKRMGTLGYKEDVWASLDAYVKRGLRKVHMDPALESTKKAAEGLEDSQFKYIKNYVDKINLRPGDIDNWIDNAIKASPIGYKLGSRPVAYVTQKARRMVYRGLLGLNFSSALRNLSQASNTYAELGERYTLLGYAKVAQNLPKLLAGQGSELHTVGVLRDGFIQDRNLNATKQLIKKADEGLFYVFNLAEKINRGAAYWGGKARALKKGLTEEQAIKEGVEVARKTQFTFGNVDTPLALQGDLMKTLAQLQSYSVKQIEFLGEKVAAKDLAGITRYIGANLLFGLTIGKLFGWEPKDMIPTLRFDTPPTLKLPQGVAESIPAQEGEDKGFLQRLAENKNVQSGLVSYFPGGSQLRKTYQGLKANSEGGVYSPTGKLRFPTEPSFKNVLTGPNVTPEAKDYYKNPQVLGDLQTQKYKALVGAGMAPGEAYQAVTANRQQEAKLKELTEEKKGFNLFNFLRPKNKETEETPTGNGLLDYMQREKKQNSDEALVVEILQTAKTPEQAEIALRELGVDMSFDQATIFAIKSLEDKNQAAYLADYMGKLSKEEYGDAMSKFVQQEVITNNIINEWVEAGTISETNGDMLKEFIKLQQGKKLSGRKKISVPKLKIPSIKKQTTKTIKIETAKNTFKPLSVKFIDKPGK